MLHTILNRQLKKLGLTETAPPSAETWHLFLERVDRTYLDFDKDRDLIEHSLSLSLREMQEVYDQLRKNEMRYALAAQGANDGLWDWDLVTGEAFYSERWMELMHASHKPANIAYSKDCWLGKIHEDDRSRVIADLDAHFCGETDHFENRHRVILEDGEEIWISARGLAFFDSKGRAVRFAGSMRDITQKKQFEAELHEAKEFLAGVIDNLPCSIIIKDYDGKIVLANNLIFEIYGKSAEELIGKTALDLLKSEELAEKVRKDDLEILNGEQNITTRELKHRDKNGNWRFFEITRRAFYTDKNEKPHLLSIGIDVTERKLMESQLSQAQKLESIGQLAAGIAHEINTPTQYVGDNTRFVKDSFNDIFGAFDEYKTLIESVKNNAVSPEFLRQTEEKLKKYDIEFLREELPQAVQQSLDGVERISKIVRSMRDFAHPGAKEMQNADLNRAIESTITVARNEWKYVADLETDLDNSLPLVPCLIGELNQVFLNMIINATHAIADATANGTKGRGKITVSTSFADKNCAEVRISDSGTGIPADVRTKIFDPFFTTKEVGKGTGQGLAISHTVVVEKHHGSISFETEMGKGTTFIIKLPLGENQPMPSNSDLGKEL
ncbi:MAG TPA: PAS domain S-box protein [Pyrinomonadaceae bacterium]|nr:PAS domain S-box protein [Pyrinomonadaceae bacterium]